MTNPTAPFGTIPVIAERVLRAKREAIERDQNMLQIGLVRQGKPELLWPELFSDTYRKSVTANFIDTAARDFSEMLAPLPALNCSSRGMRTEKDKKAAARKNMIGAHYWREARLAEQMISWADRYWSYGVAIGYVEPDYEGSMPMIRLEDPVGCYYRLDRYGDCLWLAKCWWETVDTLVSMFPEYEAVIRTKVDNLGRMQPARGEERLEVVRYCDDKQWILYLPARSNQVLVQTPVQTKTCPAVVRERPGLFHGEGAFDQVIWVQLARHRMALLSIEAGVKSVGAPLALPRDVVELAVGGDAVIQTDQPQNIRRIGYDVPPDVFQVQNVLEQDMRTGARYPEGRATGMDASVITGRGVQAIQGSFDTQIQTAQSVLGRALAQLTSLAFETDVKTWPTRSKTIYGVISGEPFELTYVPSKDVGENFVVDVTYGLAAGLAPNNAIVMMLQLRGDGLIDRDSVRRQLPWDVNVEQMNRSMDVEHTTDALKQGFQALLSGLGPMSANGVDPRPYLMAAATVIKGRQNGEALEDLILKAFDPANMQPPKPEGEEAGEAGPQDPQTAGVTGPAGALQGQDGVSGLPEGVTPGQAGMAPGGAPALQTLIAGMRNGNANMQAAVSRRLPAAG